MNQRICSAIKERRIIEFHYKGGTRKVEPFCYGINNTGNQVLRGFQIGGFSRSGNKYGWRLYTVSLISNLKVTDKYFGWNRPGYNPRDSQMTRIFCNI
jgi:hypothetical protein